MRGRRARPVFAVLAGSALLGVLGMMAARARGASGHGYQPAAKVLRLALEEVTVPAVAGVLDFDWYGEDLYLLDPLEHAVTLMRRNGSGSWDRVGGFGRYGGGPGELLRPTGIARLRDPPRIAIVDQSRLHLFDTAGAYLESLPVDVPCALPLPRIAAARRGLFVHGDCLQRTPAGDTIHAVLFWSRDGVAYREIARDARYTADGRFGTIFGARTAFTPGPEHHLFGSGVSDCVWRVDEPGAPVVIDPVPAAKRACGLQRTRFPLLLQPATRQALEGRPRGRSARIPDMHAWYEERIPGRTDLLLRGFHEDSLLLRPAAGSTDLAVLPHGLRGCRTGGCLYAESLEQGVRLRLIPIAQLHALAPPASDP